MNIPIVCRTNLDNYKREVWPTSFCCRPMVGDRVQAISGNSLRICGITHVENPGLRSAHDYEERGKIPATALIVELNK